MTTTLEAPQVRPSPFTPEDRLMHTTKMVERTFGRPAEEVGRVELDGERAVLIVSWAGKDRKLRWARSSRGAIQWYVDDDPTPIVLGTSTTAPRLLAQALNKSQ